MSRRAALLVAALLLLSGGDGYARVAGAASPDLQLPIAHTVASFHPAQHAGKAYRNVDPEYRRATNWAPLNTLENGWTLL